MDKGYDSEKIHQYIRENIGAESIIPVRKWNGNIYKVQAEMKKRQNTAEKKKKITKKPASVDPPVVLEQEQKTEPAAEPAVEATEKKEDSSQSTLFDGF